jgi:hypothetical protein
VQEDDERTLACRDVVQPDAVDLGLMVDEVRRRQFGSSLGGGAAAVTTVAGAGGAGGAAAAAAGSPRGKNSVKQNEHFTFGLTFSIGTQKKKTFPHLVHWNRSRPPSIA